MKAFFRWLARVVGSALTIVLVVVLFPYISKFAARILPDESGAAIKASAILSTKLENSARLETLQVEEEGVLNYDIQAALIGSVANINVSYVYEASFGIDLSKVVMQLTGNVITFILPAAEVLQDSLTPKEVYRDDYWYPGFSDADYEKLLQDERLARRDVYLGGEQQAALWAATTQAFEQTISAWLRGVNSNFRFQYQQAEDVPVD